MDPKIEKKNRVEHIKGKSSSLEWSQTLEKQHRNKKTIDNVGTRKHENAAVTTHNIVIDAVKQKEK